MKPIDWQPVFIVVLAAVMFALGLVIGYMDGQDDAERGKGPKP